MSIGRLCLVQGNLYASSWDGRAEARIQYQRAIDILSKLKANNQGGMGESKISARGSTKAASLGRLVPSFASQGLSDNLMQARWRPWIKPLTVDTGK